MPYEKFARLAKDSVDFVEKIASGDIAAVMCFLGLFADKHKPLNNYASSILKNPEMLKEYNVRRYIVTLMKKYMDDMKCGKLYLNACFKFLAPDLIMFMERAGGLEPRGCLDADSFYCAGKNGAVIGKRLIGEVSNCATSYHNKTPKTAEQKQKYESYIDLLSVVNGKSIDYAKTGVLFKIPRHIAKYVRFRCALLMCVFDVRPTVRHDLFLKGLDFYEYHGVCEGVCPKA